MAMTYQTGKKKERFIHCLKLFGGGGGYKLYRMEYLSQDGQEEDIPAKDRRLLLWAIFNKQKYIYPLKINRGKTGCTGFPCPFQTKGSVIH